MKDGFVKRYKSRGKSRPFDYLGTYFRGGRMRQVARTCLDNRIFERISGIYLPTITWSIIELDYPYFICQDLELFSIERNVDYDSFNDVDDILLGL